ncbi:YveK family protein [Gordonia iterans]
MVAGLLAAIVGLGGGLTVHAQTSQYEAQARLLLQAAPAPGSPNPGYDAGAGRLAMSRIESYSVLAGSENFLWRAIEENALDLSPNELRDAMALTSPKNTTLLDVSIRLTDPREAVVTATAVAHELAQAITEIESPTTIHTLVEPPDRARPAFPGAPLRIGVLTVLAIATIGAFAVLALRQWRPSQGGVAAERLGKKD